MCQLAVKQAARCVFVCFILAVLIFMLTFIRVNKMVTISMCEFFASIGDGSMSQAVLVPPSLSYKPVTSASRDHGNISHDPTCDSSCDPSTNHTSRDLSARDPGNLRPRDPGKITHDLSRNWSSTMSPDQTRFRHTSNPLINTWQIVGMINKTRPLNDQRTRDAINEDATC